MINTVNVSLEQCGCGTTISFSNPQNIIPKKDEYFLEFVVDSSLPTNSNTVTLTPSNYVIAGDNNFVPRVIAEVRSTHRGENQSLIRLVIKDRYDQILYTDYIKLICSPVSTVMLNGTINAGNNTSLGPNGFTTMSVDSTQELDIGMQITGPGIDDTTGPVSIYGILSESLIELSAVISGAQASSFSYTFTRTDSCVATDRQPQSQQLVLNKENNWKYVSNDRFVIQFVREDPNDDDIIIYIPTVNRSVLANIELDSIPSIGYIYTVGRVNNDRDCIT